MIHISSVALAAGFAAITLLANSDAIAADSKSRDKKTVTITELDGKLRVDIGGKLFTEYHYKDVSRPYFYPIIGPGGLPMTRNYPMRSDVPDEAHDHPHHRSLWYAHGDMNGHDFWSESAKAGKTVHDKFIKIASGANQGIIKSTNKLLANNGSVVCTDERTVTIHEQNGEPVLDYEITFHASNGDLTFGDTKEGSMAIRIAETMRLKGKVGHGHIVNSEGVRDGDTWGKRAKWCDYYGPVQDKILGIAIFDHPENPRHPTWWHVRDYGLFAANPFGIHDFERDSDKTKGNLTVPSGRSVTFRYRVVFHSGDEKQAKIEQRYQEYAGSDRNKTK